MRFLGPTLCVRPHSCGALRRAQHSTQSVETRVPTRSVGTSKYYVHSTMPDFAYIARDPTGQKVSGTLSAATEREVLNILSGKSLFPVSVSTSKAAIVPGANLRVRGQTMATIYSQLAALLRSGVPMLKSIAVLREQSSNKNLKVILDEVYHRV